jgi:hypothetical protein
MSDFLQQIIPPHFWIFVVLAALALHVVANYLQRLLDRSLSSGWVVLVLRGVSKRSREKRAARVQQISDWIEGNGDRAALALVECEFFLYPGIPIAAKRIHWICRCYRNKTVKAIPQSDSGSTISSNDLPSRISLYDYRYPHSHGIAATSQRSIWTSRRQRFARAALIIGAENG